MFILRQAMTVVAYILGVVAAIALTGVAVALMLAASTQSEQRRKEDLQSRSLAHQPWDAQSANGHGNR